MKFHITDVSLFGLWLDEKKQLSESTIAIYQEGVSRFLLSNPDLLKVEDYNDFIIKGSIKKRCYYYYSALKAFIEFKIEDKALMRKLIDDLIKPKMPLGIKYERKYLSEEKILGVINNLEDDKHKVIALIQTLTGVRAGDVLRLKRDNIMPEEYEGKEVLRINIIGKGRKRNVIYIHDEIGQKVILDYVTKINNFGDYYFIELGKFGSRKGKVENEFRLYRMNYTWFWKDLKRALLIEGVDRKDFATHDFRRCFARRAWTRWKDIHVLQGLLNHANPAVTLRYLEQSGLKNIDYHKMMQMGDD